MPELTDLSYVRALCEKYDFALSKGFGQNFIVFINNLYYTLIIIKYLCIIAYI